MKLKMKWIDFLENQKSSFQENKLKYILEKSISIILFLFFFSLPSFSYNRFHNIPIVFMGILCILVFLWVFIYKAFFIDKIILAKFGFMITMLITAVIYCFKDINTTIFILPIMFFVLYHYFTNKKFLSQAISLFAFGILMFSVYFFAVYFKDIVHFDFARLGANFGNQNTIGSYFAVAFGIYMYKLLFQKKWWLIFPLSIILFLGFTTGSKTFLFLIGLTTIVQIIMLFGKKRWYLSLLIIVGGGLLIFLLLQLKTFEVFRTRIYDFISYMFSKNYNDDASTAGRYNMIWEGLYLFLKRPIFGWGVEGFRYNSSFGLYAHNTIVEILTDFGLVAFILFEIPVIICLSMFKKKEKTDPLFVSLMIFLIGGLFTGVQHSSKMYHILLAFVCGEYFQRISPKKYFELSFSFENKSKDLENIENNKKYLFVAPSLDSGGAEHMVARIAKELSQKGYHVVVLLSYRVEQEYDVGGAEVISLCANLEEYKKLNKVKRLYKLRKEITKLDPTYIIPFLPYICDYVILSTCCSKYRKRIWITMRNQPDEKTLSKFKSNLKKVCGCIVQSEGQKNLFEPTVHNKIKVIPNFIEDSIFENEKEYSAEINKILAIGRLVPQKNYSMMLEAISKCKNLSKLQLTICGSGPLENEIREMVSFYKLEQHVQLVGFVNDVTERLSESDLYILTSHFEGMPNSLLEALALGVPSISTNCASVISEMIANNETGIIVPNNDVDGLIEAIDHLVDFPKEAIAMGKKAKEMIRHKYTKKEIVSLWENL